MTVSVGIEAAGLSAAHSRRLERWDDRHFGKRVWAKDATLWSEDPATELADRLGWLDLPERMAGLVPDLEAFAADITSNGFSDVVVLGMGGSSLAPEVYQLVFGNASAYPRLRVLDSTHPSAVLGIEEAIDIDRTVFVVSSKSGTTLETLSFFRYFWARVAATTDTPGDRFVAVTDHGSSLESLAIDRRFLRIFNAPPEVGGRYSALTEFGLVPAALIGVDLERLQRGAAKAATACGPEADSASNPGIALGAFLGEASLAGADKASFVASPRLQPLVAWIEQLVAESTGKHGKGIVPVGGDDESTRLRSDRVVVAIDTDGDRLEEAIDAAVRAGRPVANLRLDDVGDLGGAMFILEMAVAASGAVLGINPFDQPDVQLAKDLARRAMDGTLDAGAVEELDALDPDLTDHVRGWLTGVEPPEYVGIHAYLPPTAATRAAFDTARAAISQQRGVAATFDFGPRFLHSTGQLHKGGPRRGRFLQVIDHPELHLDVPETDYSFEKLIGAQSLGDYQALRDRGQEVLLVCLGDSGPEGLEAVMNAVVDAAQTVS